jgi:nitrogen regulatory protein PII
MKELDVYLIPEDLSKVSEIFDKHGVVSRAKHDVHGSGRSKRKEIHETVDSRMKPILRDPVFWAFMGCFVTTIVLGIKA